ncbi:hypothetical protein [Nocardia sp. SYP-A9097]|uniref:hypothetical protein n=1 Tax=Nocardia sp. SYP-A9097 TaxID=2663237 RepID=UPI001890D195|nr:hypothetical protein [Nocardia sp. SYP-A9097]
MRYWTGLIGAVAAGVCLCAAPAAAQEPKPTQPQPGEHAPVPARTSISLRSVVPGIKWGTDNETQSRGGLSISKLYLADYALRHGDGSAEDKDLGERMIRLSDDAAADTMAAKYPRAIDAIATEYDLPATHSGSEWGKSSTSTADTADFLLVKLRTDPDSPILTWMEHSSKVAADGTRQDWGTARLPHIKGTKWGWSDTGESEVASASFGSGFTVTAHTYGTSEQQTEDVLGAEAGELGPITTVLDSLSGVLGLVPGFLAPLSGILGPRTPFLDALPGLPASLSSLPGAPR